MPAAFIWGASGGIGTALTRLLKSEGWSVFAAGRTEHKLPQEADLRLEFEASNVFSFQQAAYTVAQETSALDLVIYAAGGMQAATLDEIEPETFQRVLDANLIGVQRAAAVSLPMLRDGGAFMVIGAYVDKISLPKFGAYAVAKAGLEPMLAVLRKEHRKQRFCLIRPGAVDTPFWQNVPFSLPKGAASAASVAEAILAHYHTQTAGDLNL